MSRDKKNAPEPEPGILDVARQVLQIEGEAVLALRDRIGEDFNKAVRRIYECTGRVIVTGMGKSGQISRKIAASLSSTGTPAIYIHPSEGLHGDLGMIMNGDVLLIVSNSGETEDILRMLPTLEALKVPIVAVLGSVDSSLGRRAEIALDASVQREACPHDLAPTASTTAALALGDAMAIALLELRQFRPEDFALYHPGGALGKKLLTTVEALMHQGDAVPLIGKGTLMRTAIFVITEKGLGVTGVTDDSGSLVGIITDGDLRRALEKNPDMLNLKAKEVMTVEPKVVKHTDLAVRALAIMEDYSITSLFVIGEGNRKHPVGIIHIHDILKQGIRR